MATISGHDRSSAIPPFEELPMDITVSILGHVEFIPQGARIVEVRPVFSNNTLQAVSDSMMHSGDESLLASWDTADMALMTGHETKNGMLGIAPNGEPVGSLLEAAKLVGYKTGLVVTSIVNHATPASFSSHVLNRKDYAAIAEQQVGYSHPLNQSVDILMGGGGCFFRAQSSPQSCRSDDVDLLGFAEQQGYLVAQNRSQFNDLKEALVSVHGVDVPPIIGLFHDGQLSYEADRREQPDNLREPSLSEMAATAIKALDHATRDEHKGYFIMIEASRINEASRVHDTYAHAWDVVEYNKVMNTIADWIDEHPDTVMISAARHETSSLSISENDFDVRPLKYAAHSIEHLTRLWYDYPGNNREAFLLDKILPRYGLLDATEEEVEVILKEGNLPETLANLLSQRTGTTWSPKASDHTDAHTALYTYAVGDMRQQLKQELEGLGDITELPEYLEKVLGVSIREVTELMREHWSLEA